MPRLNRIYGISGIYHVTSRGVGRATIFEDNDDREKFLSIISDAITKFADLKVSLHAFVLMDNHFHLLIKAEDKGISLVMKYIKELYAEYYNRKYEAYGPLFAGRFGSKPVDDDEYYIATLKYILNNPVRAGLCSHASEYEWSSYGCLFSRKISTHNSFITNYNKRVVNSEYAKQLYGDIAKLEMYITDGVVMDRASYENRRCNTTPTSILKDILNNIASKLGLESFKEVGKNERAPFLSMAKKSGITVAKIGLLTGYPLQIIRDA